MKNVSGLKMKLLRLLQDKIVLGAHLWGLIMTVPLTAAFVAIPMGQFLLKAVGKGCGRLFIPDFASSSAFVVVGIVYFIQPIDDIVELSIYDLVLIRLS